MRISDWSSDVCSSDLNAVWGNKPSVLVGDFLFSRAFQLMVADGSLDVLRILSNASAVIAEGEVLQLMTANDTSSDEITYMQVIEAKTAALFAAACRLDRKSTRLKSSHNCANSTPYSA